MRKLFSPRNILRLLKGMKSRITESIRIRLIIIVVISIILTMVSVFIAYLLLFSPKVISNNRDLYNLDSQLGETVQEIRYETDDKSLGDLKKIQDIIDKKVKFSSLEIQHINAYVMDLDGNILLRSGTSPAVGDDISYIIKDAVNSGLRRTGKIDRNFYADEEAVYVERLDFDDGKGIYVVMQGLSKREIYVTGGSFMGTVVPLVIGAVVFVLYFFLLTRREVEYIEELSSGVSEISKGNLDYRVKQKTRDELGVLANRINFMVEELKIKIEEERRAERTKNELITNMSHDLRTPLTSVMGYLRMLKDKKYEDANQIDEYIDIAYTKSEKLKILIDDLFIYSKLANEDTTLYKEKLCLNDLLVQLLEELAPVGEENSLSFIKDIQPERIMIEADPDKLVRVFENILSNAIKYSYTPGEIRVQMFSEGESVTVAVRNKGDNIPGEELGNLFDRLYMVDKSRSSSQNGSGLGLAIAKSIVMLHNGKVWVECEGNDISFFVQLPKLQTGEEKGT